MRIRRLAVSAAFAAGLHRRHRRDDRHRAVRGAHGAALLLRLLRAALLPAAALLRSRPIITVRAEPAHAGPDFARYGQSMRIWDRVAAFVDMILWGAKAAELPAQRLTAI